MSEARCRPPVRWALRAATGLLVLFCPSLAGVSGCLDRPVSPLEPNTTNIVIEQLRSERIERIDLLFMIDNSISMADKQKILANAVPQLVRRLVQPRCIGLDGKPTGGRFPCDQAGVEEFEPVVDIHVGVVSSSLGPHGGDPQLCANTPPANDRARLMPAVRPALDLPADGDGFLWWHPAAAFGDADVETFESRFKAHVQAAGETGCGYEASLESWYRFLIDPSPPADVTKVGDRTERLGVDDLLLAQRREFLRPDSLVAIVMLSDENDCSIRDSDLGWYVVQQGRLAQPTSTCATDPNSPCCRSCATNETGGPPPGCAPICEDAACQAGCTGQHDGLLALESDGVNLRCWQQKRRFGIDFLYPTRRYVNALSRLALCPSRPDLDPDACPEAERVPNPLYHDENGVPLARTPELVFLAGIVGVPWQDIATPETLADPTRLEYLTATELSAAERWPWITPSEQQPPLDPLMRESTHPRSGAHPSGDASLDPASPDAPPETNAANGHEWRPMDAGPTTQGDLQYACTFPLANAEPCNSTSTSCDCNKVDQAGYTENKPLCQASDGSYGTTQYAAKAYPGLRQLEVLRDYGKNSIVGSICPKLLDPASNDYGYNPAVDAIVDRLADYLQGRCLPRTLAIEDGVVPCEVVEASPLAAGCSCDAAGRTPIAASLADAVRRQLASLNACGPESPLGPCDALCLCGVQVYAGESLHACQTSTSFSATDGWCYVDPAQGYPPSNPETDQLLAKCSSQEQRLLRFEPQPGATALIACQGAAVTGGQAGG
jgi:hypothetical protein